MSVLRHPNEPRSIRRPWASSWVLVAAAAMAVGGCSSNDEPTSLPSQTTTQETSRLEAPPPLPPPIRQVQPSKPPQTVKVIEEGKSSGGPKSLAEASRLAKAQKRQAAPSVVSITDENISEYASRGDVIVLESEPAAPGPDLGEDEPDDEVLDALGEPVSGVRDEEYWRNRALEIRMGWRRTVDRIKDLELESAALRQQFYATDDPYVRDGQIKPAWDRVLDRIQQLEDRSEQYDLELNTFVAEGRQAGALQGWLNEGWELQPTPEELSQEPQKQVPAHQAINPPVIEDGSSNP